VVGSFPGQAPRLGDLMHCVAHLQCLREPFRAVEASQGGYPKCFSLMSGIALHASIHFE
jgi:hypothetical protein